MYPMCFMLYILTNHMERDHWVKILLYCTQLLYVLKQVLKYIDTFQSYLIRLNKLFSSIPNYVPYTVLGWGTVCRG